jgi:hypothetical protein
LEAVNLYYRPELDKLFEISGSHGGEHEGGKLKRDYTALHPRRLNFIDKLLFVTISTTESS